jgi:hypothetical protein
VSLGWLITDKSRLHPSSGYNELDRSLYGGATFGWYWTDNLKTEVEGGLSAKSDFDVYRPAVIDGRPTTVQSLYEFTTTRVAASQYYQFYRNAWFHPYAGVGLDVAWERTDRRDEIFSSSPTRPRQDYPRSTDVVVRPFTTLGFKAYFTPRAFFRTDLRLSFRGGVDETLLRLGLGVDF